MQLSGKCREDFDLWFGKNYPYKEIAFYGDNLKIMYFIEFFDSVEIYILVNIENTFFYEIESKYRTFRKRGFTFTSRLESKKAGVLRADEMYNSEEVEPIIREFRVIQSLKGRWGSNKEIPKFKKGDPNETV